MPMFKALDACPDAVVIRPNMAKYRAVGLQLRELMRSVTPLVEPLSIDEPFLDLTGTEALHHGSAARSLARLVLRIEPEIGEIGRASGRERVGQDVLISVVAVSLKKKKT